MKRGLFILLAVFFYNSAPAFASLETGAAELKQPPVMSTPKVNKYSAFYMTNVICTSSRDGFTIEIGDEILETACLKAGYDHVDKAHVFKNGCSRDYWFGAVTGIVDFRCVAYPEL